jgi:hypothetical protein
LVESTSIIGKLGCIAASEAASRRYFTGSCFLVSSANQRAIGRAKALEPVFAELAGKSARVANPAYRFCMFPCRIVVLFSIAVGFLRMSATR